PLCLIRQILTRRFRLCAYEQVDVTVWRTTQALSVRDLLPHMQGMRKADIIRRLENELGETAEDV
ncbi:TPA: hypothetical protein ACHK0J_004291, partial [Escherichia coli]